MSKKLKLDIPNPCSQKWHKMSKTDQGRFCNHCSAEVVDFAGMSISELKNYFQAAPGKVCGRMDQVQFYQLNQETVPLVPNHRFSLKIAAASFIALLVACKGSAQQAADKPTVYQAPAANSKLQSNSNHVEDTFIIKGLVRAKENLSPIYGAIVNLPSLNLKTSTNNSGTFELMVKGAAKQKVKLFINGLGYEDQQVEVTLGQSAQNITISLAPEKFLMGEVVVVSPTAQKQSISMGTNATSFSGRVAGVALSAPEKTSFFKRVVKLMGTWFK